VFSGVPHPHSGYMISFSTSSSNNATNLIDLSKGLFTY